MAVPRLKALLLETREGDGHSFQKVLEEILTGWELTLDRASTPEEAISLLGGGTYQIFFYGESDGKFSGVLHGLETCPVPLVALTRNPAGTTTGWRLDSAGGTPEALRRCIENALFGPPKPGGPQGDLLGQALHQMKNPLSAIMGNSEFLQERDSLSAEEMQKIVEANLAACRQMEEALRHISDLHLIQRGLFKLNKISGRLQDLVAETVERNRPPARRKNISLEAVLADLQEFYFDPVRIGQTVHNLIGNAIKFSPPGTRVRIRLDQEDAMARLQVVDEGPGIAPEDRPRLFQPFAVLRARPTGGEFSTHMELAINKFCAELHLGTLEAETPAGAGARFTLKLPMQG